MSEKDSKPKKSETPKKSQIEKETTGIEGSDDKNSSGNLKNDQSQELNQIIEELKQVKEDLKKELEDTKEFKKFKQAVVKFQGSLDNNAKEVKNLKEQLSETNELINDSLKSELKETNATFKESIYLRQNQGILRRKIEKWQDFAVDFFDSLERMSLLSQDDKYKEAVEKVIEDFDRLVNDHDLKLERINPDKKDDLEEEFHEATEEKESADVKAGKVIECQKWGYKINDQLYKGQRAKVVVAKQVTKTSKGDTLVKKSEGEKEFKHEISQGAEEIEKASESQDSKTSANTSKQGTDNQK